MINRIFYPMAVEIDIIRANMDSGNNKFKDKIDAFRAKCRAAGLKVTPQRIMVYKELVKTDEHPSAEKLYNKVKKALPNISLDTVNRTLLTLNEIGAAFIVEGTGDPKRYDGNIENHQHFKCIKCRKIFDFRHKEFDNIKVPASIKKKFTILRRTVYLEGICNSCRG